MAFRGLCLLDDLEVPVEQELVVSPEPCMVGVPPVSAVLRTHIASMFSNVLAGLIYNGEVFEK